MVKIAVDQNYLLKKYSENVTPIQPQFRPWAYG